MNAFLMLMCLWVFVFWLVQAFLFMLFNSRSHRNLPANQERHSDTQVADSFDSCGGRWWRLGRRWLARPYSPDSLLGPGRLRWDRSQRMDWPSSRMGGPFGRTVEPSRTDRRRRPCSRLTVCRPAMPICRPNSPLSWELSSLLKYEKKIFSCCFF